MTLRFSPALQNFIAEDASWKDFFDNGSIEIYTGTQPATADLAPTGTLLVTLTSSSGAKTNEVAGTGVITYTSSGGSVDTVSLLGLDILGGAVAYDTSLTVTAAAVALKINRNPKNKFVIATSSLGVLTLTALPGFGTLLNSAALATTTTTMVGTVTSTTFGSGTGGSVAGVNAANGLKMDWNAAAGVLTKDVTQTWSGVAVGAGTQTAGWFRYKGGVVDAGALDASAVFKRMDGSIATSGADMNMSSTAIANGATITLSTFSFTIPAA
jgi:hypothetical protein